MLYTWFLIVTISTAAGEYSVQGLDHFDSLTECETAAYQLQDKAIMYEKDHSAEVELECMKHTTKTTI